MSDLPAPAPSQSPETEQFWNATAEGRFLLPRCTDCEVVYYYPRAVCPYCLDDDIEWTEASGWGTIYSYTVIRQARGAYAEATPYVLAYVELAEGPRMLTNVVGVDSEALAVGDEVKIVFEKTDEGVALPRFQPA